MKDNAIGDVAISKTDAAGSKELDGAKLTVKDSSGNSVIRKGENFDGDGFLTEPYTSKAGKDLIIKGSDLKVDEVYTITEEGAPKG